MPQVIEVPGQGQVEFPDSMSDADIVNAINRSSKPAADTSFMGKLGYATRDVLNSLPWTPAGAHQTLDTLNYANKKIEGAAYDAGGKVTDLTGSPAAGGLTNLGIQAAPTFIGGMANIGGNAMRNGAEWLMQSAVKPGVKDVLLGKAGRAISTMLDEGINVSRSGMNKLRGLGDAANQEAANAVAGSTAQVNKNAVASRLSDVERKFQAQVNPQSDLNAIQDADTAFLTHPQLAGQQTMPVQLAQELKQGTYQQLRDKYGEMGNASTEAQKALARGLKEEIESAVPGVVEPNARASELWNALNVSQRRAMMAANLNPTGLATLASNPKAAAAFLLDRSSVAKSLAARLLNNSQRVPGTVAGGIVGSDLGFPREDDAKQYAAQVVSKILEGQR